jgi:putative intracellular protease/amidase
VRVLIPLPDRDFDVTEVAVPWRVLRDAGHQVVFATEQAGTLPAADPRLLTGVIFGQLGAAPEARVFYSELTRATEFTSTAAWAGLDPAAFDGLLLPGGHAPGMRQYLGSPVLREQAARFWALGRPVGAICHGVLVLARTRDPATGRSILAGQPACPSTWNASPTWRPPGGWAAITGPIPPTSRTRSKLPWTTRAASSSEDR